jgi:hypothetical protein
MRVRTALLAGAVAVVVAGGIAGGIAVSQAAVTPNAAVAGGAPYIFPADNGSVNPVSVMQKTGVRAFTLAFILNRGNCSPVWNESASLSNGAITSRINAIRRAGGDVVVSFGGFSGNKLGNACKNETALAAAYQKVINTFRLKAIDIDLEAGEVSQSVKVLKALKIVKRNNPGVQIIMTLGTGTGGLVGDEAPIPGQAGAMGSPVDVWTIMPFDFSNDDSRIDHGKASVSASEGLHRQLKSALKLSDAKIYAMQGISSMNGRTDNRGNVTVGNFNTMLAYCRTHHLARFTFWELSRDPTLKYTRVIGQFTG